MDSFRKHVSRHGEQKATKADTHFCKDHSQHKDCTFQTSSDKAMDDHIKTTAHTWTCCDWTSEGKTGSILNSFRMHVKRKHKARAKQFVYGHPHYAKDFNVEESDKPETKDMKRFVNVFKALTDMKTCQVTRLDNK